jgi:hypothetical protein
MSNFPSANVTEILRYVSGLQNYLNSVSEQVVSGQMGREQAAHVTQTAVHDCLIELAMLQGQSIKFVPLEPF